jgi:hypothetical protein
LKQRESVDDYEWKYFAIVCDGGDDVGGDGGVIRGISGDLRTPPIFTPSYVSIAITAEQ